MWPFGEKITVIIYCEGSESMPRERKKWRLKKTFRVRSRPRLGEKFGITSRTIRYMKIVEVRVFPGRPTEIELEGAVLPYESDYLAEERGWQVTY